MSQTLTIELPDDIMQQAEASANAMPIPLQKLMADVLVAFLGSLQSLQNADPDIRTKAIAEIGNLKTEATIPILKEALQDEDLTVQKTAATALQNIGTEQALNVLRQSSYAQDDPLSADFDALLDLAGTLDIGTTDLGDNHDRYIAEVLERELLPDE